MIKDSLDINLAIFNKLISEFDTVYSERNQNLINSRSSQSIESILNEKVKFYEIQIKKKEDTISQLHKETLSIKEGFKIEEGIFREQIEINENLVLSQNKQINDLKLNSLINPLNSHNNSYSVKSDV